jgi:hypothetical protein
MRQGPNNKRMRGRGNGRKHSNPRNHSFESNGPDVKVRGNAQQVVEKYLTLARDATSAGDRISAESYYQHAEHYYRILNANAPNDQQRSMAPGDDANGMGMDDDSADEMIEAEASDGNGEAQPNGNGRSNGSRRRSGRRKDPSEEPQPDVAAEAVAADESPAGETGESANA